ncbi:MAG: cupin, partial [Xanthobacteraceae bacterium]
MARSTQVRKLKKTASSAGARNSNRSTPKGSARRRGVAAKRKAKTDLRKQVFAASHHTPDAFEAGLRRYAHYRDLGI